MQSPPKVISLELTGQDVKCDLGDVVDSMVRIRREASTTDQVSDEQKDEYLHLTYRLASAMRGISDEGTMTRAEKVAKAVKRDDRLLLYDPRQDGFWMLERPRFVRDLELLLIGVHGDHFYSMDVKHHVLQATKYLSVMGEGFEERERMYDTILPCHGAVSLNSRRGIVRRALDFLLGDKFEVYVGEGNTLVMNDTVHIENIQGLIDFAKPRGYGRLHASLSSFDFEAYEEELSSISEVVGKSDGDKVTLSFPFSHTYADNAKSPHEYFERIASLEVPQEIEENLLWHEGNHHSFGKRFQKHVEQQAGRPSEELEIVIDRKNQVVVYSQSLPVGMYQKGSGLFCFSNQRYTVTVITDNIDNSFVPDITGILVQPTSEKEKLMGMAGLTKEVYFAHLERHENGKQTHDLEVVSI